MEAEGGRGMGEGSSRADEEVLPAAVARGFEVGGGGVDFGAGGAKAEILEFGSNSKTDRAVEFSHVGMNRSSDVFGGRILTSYDGVSSRRAGGGNGLEKIVSRGLRTEDIFGGDLDGGGDKVEVLESETSLGAVQGEVREVCDGVDLVEEGTSCLEANDTAENDALLYHLFNGHPLGPENASNRRGGGENGEGMIAAFGKDMEAAEAHSSLMGYRGLQIEDIFGGDVDVGGAIEGEENMNPVQDDVPEIYHRGRLDEGISCLDIDQTLENDVTVQDLLDRHLLVTEDAPSQRGSGDDSSEQVVAFTAESLDMSRVLASGTIQEVEAQAMERKAEVGGWPTVQIEQNRNLKASFSQEGAVYGEETMSGRLVKPADVPGVLSIEADVPKGSGHSDPLAAVHKIGSYPQQKDGMGVSDLVIPRPGKDAFTVVPVVAAETGDRHLNNDAVATDSVTYNVRPVKVYMGSETETACIHLGDEFMMVESDTSIVDVGSASGTQIIEQQGKDIFENPEDKPHTIDNLLLSEEGQAAVVCPPDKTLIEKNDIILEDPTSVKYTTETSEPSEIQLLASQGKQTLDFSFGENEEIRAHSVGFLANERPSAAAHVMESPPSKYQTDTDSNVVNCAVSPQHECCTSEVVQSESEGTTQASGDGVPEGINDAGTPQTGEQELVGSAEDQSIERVTAKPWTLHVKNNQRTRYYFPQYSSEFSIYDLVWGKVKSHPWWPGQIFDFSDASELALKHQKKDNFLVAYFGDRTFAWRNKSQLKPFYTNFQQMENQSNSDAFISAVGDALGEVSRRAELGMSCSCIPEKNCSDIKYIKFENAGIQEGISASSFDRSMIVKQFQPEKLLEYVGVLAQLPTGGFDKLDLIIAQAQLKAFYSSKGYPELPQFIYGGWLIDNYIDSSASLDRKTMDVIQPVTLAPSELIPAKRKRGRPRKYPESTWVSGDLVELSSSGDNQQMEVPIECSSPLSAESVPIKRKRGRPRKNQTPILGDGTKQNIKPKKGKTVSRIVNGGGSGSGVKTVRMSNFSSGVKRKIDHPDSTDTDKKRRKMDFLRDSKTNSPSPTFDHSIRACVDDSGRSKKGRPASLADVEVKPPSAPTGSSFMIGEYIRRVASKLTGSSPILKFHDETAHKNASEADYNQADAGIDAFPYTPVSNRKTKKETMENYSTPDEMLSQLCLAGKDPLKEHTFSSSVVSFFTKFRNSVASEPVEDGRHSERVGAKRGRKKKVIIESDSSDTSKPDYMKDSYWSDMILDNSSEKRLLSNGLKRQSGTDSRKQKRRRKSSGLSPPSLSFGPVTETQQMQFGALSPKVKPAVGAERSIIIVEEKIMDTPTALVLSFSSSDSLPSETDLIRIFGRYGPLKEEETEVLRKSNRVKVVFKRRADAEIAFSSAGKFSIFGPALVSYRLRYSVSTPKSSPDTSPQSKSNAAAPGDGGNLKASALQKTMDTLLQRSDDTSPAVVANCASVTFLSQTNDYAVDSEDVSQTTMDMLPQCSDATPPPVVNCVTVNFPPQVDDDAVAAEDASQKTMDTLPLHSDDTPPDVVVYCASVNLPLQANENSAASEYASTSHKTMDTLAQRSDGTPPAVVVNCASVNFPPQTDDAVVAEDASQKIMNTLSQNSDGTPPAVVINCASVNSPRQANDAAAEDVSLKTMDTLPQTSPTVVVNCASVNFPPQANEDATSAEDVSQKTMDTLAQCSDGTPPAVAVNGASVNFPPQAGDAVAAEDVFQKTMDALPQRSDDTPPAVVDNCASVNFPPQDNADAAAAEDVSQIPMDTLPQCSDDTPPAVVVNCASVNFPARGNDVAAATEDEPAILPGTSPEAKIGAAPLEDGGCVSVVPSQGNDATPISSDTFLEAKVMVLTEGANTEDFGHAQMGVSGTTEVQAGGQR